MHRNYMISQNKAWIWLKEHPLAPIYTILAGYVFYSFFWPVSPHPGRAFFLMLVFIALFLKPSPLKKSRYFWWIDWLLAILSLVVFGYIVLFHYEISLREGLSTNTDITMGVLAILLSIEGTRRGMGTSLMVIVCLFLAYLLFGQYLPPDYGGHVGYDLEEITHALYLATELDGIFGISTYIFCNYIFPFFLFGNLLLRTNASKFIMDSVISIIGRSRGGAAMVSVIGSGTMGSISGMAMGNVMLTGVITIPLMQKSGYKPWVAAGVEASASSGGQIMPPVMGTASFLMMAFLSVPYLYVVKASVIPALLFYVSILSSVYFYSVRAKVQPLKSKDIPNLREVLKGKEAFTFISSFGVLIYLIVTKSSPIYSVMCAMLVAFIVSFFTPSRMSFFQILDLIYETGLGFVGLGAAAAGIGIVIAVTLQTGLVFGITDLLLNFTQGSIPLTLIAVFFACFIMGMGLPPVICYILSVLLGAPALIDLGIEPIAAHLFCFYAAICSEVSPPIAPAAYVAAMLANTRFWKVCGYSMLFSISAHILPFAFVVDNSMLLLGDFKRVLWVIGTATAGVLLQSWGIAGRFGSYFDVIARIFVFFGGVLMIFPGMTNTMIGMAAVSVGGAFKYLDRIKYFKSATIYNEKTQAE